MVLAAVVLLLLQTIPTLGQPRLVVTTAGIRLPHTPVVSWQLIEGMWLQKNPHRERVMSHSLMFYVPALPSQIHRFPWFMRLFHRLRTRRGRQRLSVWLLNSSEDPDMVYRLAQHLWKQSTGRSRPWFPEG